MLTRLSPTLSTPMVSVGNRLALCACSTHGCFWSSYKIKAGRHTGITIYGSMVVIYWLGTKATDKISCGTAVTHAPIIDSHYFTILVDNLGNHKYKVAPTRAHTRADYIQVWRDTYVYFIRTNNLPKYM